MAINVNYIKHGQFSFDDEKIEEIAKNLEVVNKKSGLLSQFFSPAAEINGDQIIKRRQVLLDPVSIADLNEGDTPRQDSIKVVTFSEKTRSVGSFIAFGRHAVKRNRDSITDMCRRQLAHARLYDAEAIRFIAMNSATYTADAVWSSSKFNWWQTLTNLSIRLDKNGAKGDYVFLCTPEIAADIAREMKEANSLLQGTAQGADLIKNGYLGDYCGFHIVKNKEGYMYENVTSGGSTVRYMKAFAFGKTEDGKWPLLDTGMGSDPQGEVIVKDLGSGGPSDPTNEEGTIASRLDNVAAFIEHPECFIRIANVKAASSGNYALAEVGGELPGAYELEANVSTGVGTGRDNADLHKIVAGGGTVDMVFKAVKAADGDALTIATATIKSGKTIGSGTAVTPNADGSYTLQAGKWYNYSLAVTGYKDSADSASSTAATGTVYVDPDHPELVRSFVANS